MKEAHWPLALRAQGYRMTPQRWAILRVLHSAEQHLSPGEVFAQAAKDVPGLTEATVYRSLDFLTRQRLVFAAHIGNGKLVYEIAHCNHHHLICRQCGEMREIDHQQIEPLYQQFQQQTGYQIDSSHMTFFGLCPNCQTFSGES